MEIYPRKFTERRLNMTNENAINSTDMNNEKNQLKQFDDHIIYYDKSLSDVKQELKKLNYPNAIIKKYSYTIVLI